MKPASIKENAFVAHRNPLPRARNTINIIFSYPGQAEYGAHRLIQPNMPVALTSMSVVRIPAPIRSPSVAGVMAAGFATLADPAFGFPALVPPVAFVRGAPISASGSRFVKITDIAAICCPTPCVPSQTVPFDQLNPHVRPLAPPEHCCAAAMAEARSLGMMISRVQGARKVV